jgi:hypothetical protein
LLDLAETTVLRNIKDGDTADAKWYLTKKGKHRGYSDRMELTGADGGDLPIVILRPGMLDDLKA